jgi:colicin import membrane protein
MSAQSPGAFGLSALLHGAAVALVLYFAYASHTDDDTPKVLELVAGEGNNFAATEAPALGNGGTTKLTQPAPLPVDPTPVQPAPTPAPEQPAPIQSAPEAPTKPVPAKPLPAAKPKTTKPPKPVDLLTSLKKAEARRTARLEKAYAAKKAAEEKREAAEAAKAARIDAEGIRQGVLGGSTENKVGGAGGRALSREQASLMDAYFAELKIQMRENFTPVEGVTDNISVKIGFFVAADGAISRVRVLSSSGNAEFDRAVVEACQRIRMPARPDGQSDESSTRFNLHEDESS